VGDLRAVQLERWIGRLRYDCILFVLELRVGHSSWPKAYLDYSWALMKKITLPITQTYSSTLDLMAIPKENIVQREGHVEIHFPLMDFAESNKVLQTVRENGSLVVYAATSIEGQIDQILLHYFFGPASKPNLRRDYFLQNILQSESLTYAFKRNLLTKIVNLEELLVGGQKNKLDQNLKSIMTWRNAFAHGTIHYDASYGAEIKYFSGSPQVQPLSDDFWNQVESCYGETDRLLTDILQTLAKLDSPKTGIDSPSTGA